MVLPLKCMWVECMSSVPMDTPRGTATNTPPAIRSATSSCGRGAPHEAAVGGNWGRPREGGRGRREPGIGWQLPGLAPVSTRRTPPQAAQAQQPQAHPQADHQPRAPRLQARVGQRSAGAAAAVADGARGQDAGTRRVATAGAAPRRKQHCPSPARSHEG